MSIATLVVGVHGGRKINKQDPSTKQWQSMPYEIAAAFVRTLSSHWKELQDAKTILNSHLETDIGRTKDATRKAERHYLSLKQKKRYIIMNRRTSQMATQEWVSRNVTTNQEGVPQVKAGKKVWVSRNVTTNQEGVPQVKAGKKVQPWIMTMEVTLTSATKSSQAAFSLKLTSSSPAAPVRCWELPCDKPEASLSVLLAGYDFEEEPEIEDGGDVSEAESLETVPGDELGLEGDVFSTSLP